MATPSLAMIPSAYADSKVYSVLPNNGDGDFTFNRDSSATRIGQNGLIQTVGFFGSEETTNGSFTGSATGWTLSGSVAYNNNALDSNAGGSATQSGILTSGKNYKINIVISAYTSGIMRVKLGTTASTTFTETTTVYVTSNGTDFILDFLGSFVGTIDSVSVVEVTGDQPRLNYDISNGVVQSCPSLLLEPASTNLINFSEPTSSETSASGITYESYIWAIGRFTNCIKFGDNSVTRYRYFTGTIANSTQYVMSAFVIMDDLSEPVLGTNTVSGDLIFRVGGESASTGNLPNVNMGNSIYRVSSVITSGASGGTTGLLKYTGQSNKGFRVVGFQVEELSYATSYIPTNGSSQTRAAETCNDAGNATTFNSIEGVLYVETKASVHNGNITLSSGSNNDNLIISFNLNSGRIDCNMKVGGAYQFIFNYTTDMSLNHKIAISYAENDFSLFVDGTKVLTDTSGITPTSGTLNELNFSSANQASNLFYGNVKDIRVYNEALTDAQLQTLTTL